MPEDSKATAGGLMTRVFRLRDGTRADLARFADQVCTLQAAYRRLGAAAVLLN